MALTDFNGRALISTPGRAGFSRRVFLLHAPELAGVQQEKGCPVPITRHPDPCRQDKGPLYPGFRSWDPGWDDVQLPQLRGLEAKETGHPLGREPAGVKSLVLLPNVGQAAPRVGHTACLDSNGSWGWP